LLLARQAALALGVASPLGEKAAQLYDYLVAQGGRGKDFSAMLPYLSQIARGV
jgi:3-hydroxyisobutyrate dehydrogenase